MGEQNLYGTPEFTSSACVSLFCLVVTASRRSYDVRPPDANFEMLALGGEGLFAIATLS